jgi:hypothetical protein
MLVADKRDSTKSIIVQCPVGPLKEAQILAKSVLKAANSAYLNRPQVTPVFEGFHRSCDCLVNNYRFS